MWELMLFFTVCIARFITTNLISTTAANKYSSPPTYFAFRLSQELVTFQAIWCISFPLLFSWSTTRNNISYVTRILYRLSCLFYLFPSFGPPVVNNFLCKIVVELFRVIFIPPLTSLAKIGGINIIHSKDWIINSDTPILGLKLPLQLEIILPCTVALINIQISGRLYFIHPWLIDLKFNTNWICIGGVIHLSKPVICIWHTRFQGWGVRNEIPLFSVNPNEDELVQLLPRIESKLSFPQTPTCKLYLWQFCHTETSGFCPHHTNESQATLLELVTCLHQRKVAVCTDNPPLFIYPWLQNI